MFEQETSWPSVTRNITSAIEMWENILSTPSPAHCWIFYFLSTWSIRHLLSPSLLFFLLNNILCVFALACGCLRTDMCIDCWCHTLPQPVWVGLFNPVCLCWDSGCPLIFKHPLIQIQKLVFPPMSAGSHWDRVGMAHYANEASFMDAANNGSLQKSV